MKGYTVGSILLIVNLVAMGVAGALAAKAGNRDLPTFIRSVIGTAAALLVEMGRGLVCFLIGYLSYGVNFGDQMPGWALSLYHFRIVHVPILLAVGFTAGATGGLRQIACPGCKRQIEVDATFIQRKPDHGASIAAASSLAADTYTETCPHCKARMVIRSADISIESWERAVVDDDSPQPPRR